ncbi:HAD-IIB family hydrolase [Marinomonas algicola]|uniref:HAD-IIB family hydrolase n=1 Tax=Marinomonas algicola TaxID=2773454 RepID=UPI00174D475A|nr:HAD-IIB family hydrolase [Marinomonas algicola]
MNKAALPKLSETTPLLFSKVKFILTDIDDTLTWESSLPTETFQALGRLHQAGYKIIPVTGGCAGWSDLIARLWPVAGVITEGGACFLSKDTHGRLVYKYWDDPEKMQANKERLLQTVDNILPDFPKLKLAQDQAYRLTDVAVDYAQDVIPKEEMARDQMLARLKALGVQAKASSIHINIWQGEYDKYAMAHRVLTDVFGLTEDELKTHVMYVGDAPNDESMFAKFPLSIGVANISQHLDKMDHRPAMITSLSGGYGFAELADYLLAK